MKFKIGGINLRVTREWISYSGKPQPLRNVVTAALALGARLFVVESPSLLHPMQIINRKKEGFILLGEKKVYLHKDDRVSPFRMKLSWLQQLADTCADGNLAEFGIPAYDPIWIKDLITIEQTGTEDEDQVGNTLFFDLLQNKIRAAVSEERQRFERGEELLDQCVITITPQEVTEAGISLTSPFKLCPMYNCILNRYEAIKHRLVHNVLSVKPSAGDSQDFMLIIETYFLFLK
jgi:hypothetical protein